VGRIPISRGLLEVYLADGVILYVASCYRSLLFLLVLSGGMAETSVRPWYTLSVSHVTMPASPCLSVRRLLGGQS
jgi:hypothetical protein